MINNDDFWDEKEKKYIEKEEENKRRFSSFILLFLVIGVGGIFALGLSLSALGVLNGNETINTIISSLIGDDGKGKYIITYVENTIGEGENGQKIIKDDFLHIVGAKVSDTKGNANGEVVFFGGLMLTTKNTFSSNDSSVTYEVILKNDSSSDKTFEKLLFNKDGNVKYTVTGLNPGDIIKSGSEAKIYLTVEYNGDKNTKYPVEVESSVDISYRKEDKSIHIVDAKVNGTKNGGNGEVKYFEGLFLTTSNTFENNNSQVGYKLTIKNDSDIAEAFSGIVFNPNGDVKYTISGIKSGDILEPGESVTVYILVEPNGDLTYPKTVESSIEFRFATFTIVEDDNGIHLLKQFPTSDDVGKLFDGKHYAYNFTLILGKKATGAYYELTGVENADNNLDPSYVKIYLEKNEQAVPFTLRENGKVKTFNEFKKSEHEGTEGKVIFSDYVTSEDVARGKIQFKLRMWISDELKINENNMNNVNDKKFGIRVNTYAQFEV